MPLCVQQSPTTRHVSLPLRSGPIRGLSRLCKQHNTKRSVQANSLKKLAVFVSGGGSNLQQIHKACAAGHIKGEIVVCLLSHRNVVLHGLRHVTNSCSSVIDIMQPRSYQCQCLASRRHSACERFTS